MTVRLTVQRAEWQRHVRSTAERYGHGLVPVVKGNGYGFGRALLHQTVVDAGQQYVCVGTEHELHDVPSTLTPIVLTPIVLTSTVLTPTLADSAGRTTHPQAVFTVGNVAHVAPLTGSGHRVIVKLASSMRRYGVEPTHLPDLLTALDQAGLEPLAFGLHLPLAGDDDARVAQIESWLPHLTSELPLWVSHLRPDTFAALDNAHPDRSFAVRVGTALWHGVPRQPFVRLSAEVTQTHQVNAHDRAGYWNTPIPHDGTLLAIAAGSAHGIAPLDEPDAARRSPFHFGGLRLPLLERPHMHTSLVVVPRGQPCPGVGERVDVQRPLITTTVDELEWI